MLTDGAGELPADDWRTRLKWAREHADRIDPLKQDFLGEEKERLTNLGTDE